MWDRGQRTAVLDPARPGGLRRLDELVGRADVVLAGTRAPGMSYGDLRGRGREPGRPALWVVLPPYLLGTTPWAGGRESAGLLFAALGHAWSQASYADVPVDCVFPLALHMQGIWAAAAAVAALAGRDAGRRVAPMVVAGGAHGAQLVSPGGFAAGRDDPHEHRPGGPGGALANYRCYRCADGRWLFLGAFTAAFIDRGFRAVGAGPLLDDPRVGGDPAAVRLPGNVEWIAAELAEIFRTRPRDHWLAALEEADVPVAAVGETADWLDHEQVRAIGLRFDGRNDAGQDVVMPGPLIALSRTPAAVTGPAATRHTPIEDLDTGWDVRGPGGWATAGGAEPPLAGLRALNLGTIIAGPYAATLLGELGADVVKVERPPYGDEFRTAHGGRGGAGSGFTVYNRDHRSILLDLAGDPGRDVFARLVRASDVVVDNYRAGVADRLGIGHASLAAINPLVTSVSINGFGNGGPLGHRPGFDPVVQAMSGIMRAQGGPDEADSPVFLTVPINDVLAAGLGALGACAALYARPRLGAGQRVEISLCASSCLLQSAHLVRFSGAPPSPVGGRDFPGPAPADRLHACADGWIRLAAPDGFAAAEPAEIAGTLAALPVAEALRRANEAGIPAVRARQPQELAADRDLIDNGLLAVTERDDAGGAVRVRPGRWLDMPGLHQDPPGAAPAAGEHERAILAGLDAPPGS
ncbi:MAG TPA: CoA transferase, partial [Streptosporangiaceae bacterium]